MLCYMLLVWILLLPSSLPWEQFLHSSLSEKFGFHDFRTHYSAIMLAGSVHVQVVLPDMKCSEAHAQLLSTPWLEALG